MPIDDAPAGGHSPAIPSDDPLVDRIQAAYDRRLAQVGGLVEGVQAYTQANPWRALTLALAAGWVAGRLTSRPRVYVRPVRPR